MPKLASKVDSSVRKKRMPLRGTGPLLFRYWASHPLEEHSAMKPEPLRNADNPLRYEKGDSFTYRAEIPLYATLDDVLASWEDVGYFTGDEDKFVQGEGCNWEETRTIKIEVEISRRSAKVLNRDLKAVIDAMLEDIVSDMERRPCNPPCEFQKPKIKRTSKSIVWGRCAELITDPDANPPYGLPPYRHYICLQYMGTYEVTVKCAQAEDGA